MKHRHNTLIAAGRFAAATVLMSCAASALADHSINRTGPHGANVTGSTQQQGNKFSGSGTVTGARGKSASGQYSGAVTPAGATANGSVTGPQGNQKSATVTATQGTATVTGGDGQTKSFVRKPQS